MVATLEAWLILSWSSILWQKYKKKTQYNFSYQIQMHTCTKKQTISNLTNMIWPSKTSGHTNPVIAHSWDLILLNCFLSETRCGLSQFCWNSPTVLFWAAYTSECASPPWNWQVTAASPRYQGGAEDGVKTNLAAGKGPVWASVRDLEWLGNCSAASEKGRNQENKSVQQEEFEGLSRFRLWVRKECWLQCIRSHDGCVYLLHTSLLNLIDWLENNNYILHFNDKYLLH